MEKLAQKVYEFLRTIPQGKVVTYGDIAAYLGNKNLARVVGNILHQNPNPNYYPCYKVVNSQGKLSSHFAYGGLLAQKRRLIDEGIIVNGDKVNLDIYRMK